MISLSQVHPWKEILQEPEKEEEEENKEEEKEKEREKEEEGMSHFGPGGENRAGIGTEPTVLQHQWVTGCSEEEQRVHFRRRRPKTLAPMKLCMSSGQCAWQSEGKEIDNKANIRQSEATGTQAKRTVRR